VTPAELRAAGVLCTDNLNIHGTVSFEPPVRLFDHINLMDVSIGAYTYSSFRTRLTNCSVGRYCSIGDYCVLNPGAHPSDWLSTSPFPYHDIFNVGATSAEFADRYPPILIGNDVWIGGQSSVMGGVTIGDGAIVALGSVVTKDVPPYAIVAGVPARIVKYRFAEELIADLLAFCWWRLDIPSASRAGFAPSWGDPAAALAAIKGAEAAGTLKPVSAARVTFSR
jgi:acetyltransferase-like isoleucine patch superfamily enzyme